MANEIEPWTPRAPGALTTLGQVRKELAQVYRDSRLRRVNANEGTKLTYILTMLARIIQGDELERRLEELEKQITNQGGRVIHVNYDENEAG